MTKICRPNETKKFVCPGCRSYGWSGYIKGKIQHDGETIYVCNKGFHYYTHGRLMAMLKTQGGNTMVDLKSRELAGNYMRATDIVNNDAPSKVQIDGARIDTIQEEEKVVVEFDDIDWELVLNQTREKVLRDKLGDETDDWKGAKLILSTAKIPFKGKQVDTITIERITAPKK